MVVSIEGRSVGASSSKGLFRRFRHPLLRLAAQVGDTPQQYREIQRMLRRTLSTADRDQRLEAAQRVLEILPRLGMERENVEALRLEWLREIADTLESPVLLEAQALAELAAEGMALAKSSWQPALDTDREGDEETKLPTLVASKDEKTNRPSLRNVAYVPHRVSSAWRSAVGLALRAVEQGRHEEWHPDDCSATIRMLTALVVNACSEDGFASALERLAFFEGVGLFLWNAMDEQIERTYDNRESERVRTARLQRHVLLHLRGQVLSSELMDGDTGEKPGGHKPASEAASGSGFLRVLAGPIPPSFNREDSEVIKAYAPLLEPQPVTRLPDAAALDALLGQLASEFPWATSVVDELAVMLRSRSLFGVHELVLSPMLLVGPPGAGKSRLARRLAELLQLPFLPLMLGGSHDSKLLAGTSRGWATGEPSPLLGMMLQHRSASGLVLLDEIDKAADGASNSKPATAVLLGLLEPETSSRWQDSFLRVNCNLSRLCFCATANGLAAIPRPLLSRFTLLYMPEPRPEDRAALVQGITDDIAREWGLPLGVLPTVPEHVYQGAAANGRELRRNVYHYLYHWAQEHRRPERMH